GNFNVSSLGAPNAITLFNDGNGYGNVETINLGQVIFDTGIIPNITVQRAGATLPLNQPANKILSVSVPNVILGLTTSNANGYGLAVTDSVTLNSGVTFNVPNATNSNVTQGLYLNGNLGGTGSPVFSKIGVGTLVLGASNSFAGTVNVQGGVLSISDDGQLG